MGDKCGSMECMDIIDKMAQRLNASLGQQQQDGLRSLKELMSAHYNNLSGHIQEFKKTVETDQADMWPRLRKVESKFDVLDAAIGPEGLNKQIASISEAAIDLRAHRSWQRRKSDLAIMVVSGIIVTLLCAVIIARYIPGDVSGKAGTRVEIQRQSDAPKK